MRSLKWILLLMLQISKQLNYMGKTCPPTTILYKMKAILWKSIF